MVGQVAPGQSPHSAVGKDDVRVSAESERGVEEVVQDLEFPGVEVGTVREGLDTEKDVGLP